MEHQGGQDMDKRLVGNQERICCLPCGWEGRVSELKQKMSEMLDETWFHSCPNCETPLVMETETQAYLSNDSQSLEVSH